MSQIFAPGRYILRDKMAVPEPSLIKWAKWFEAADRHVAKTQVGGCWISTVFLGLDHSCGHGEPQLFETMIFRGGKGDETFRCASWQEAEKQHAEAVEQVRREIKERVND
jgi:hypothetical protein